MIFKIWREDGKTWFIAGNSNISKARQYFLNKKFFDNSYYHSITNITDTKVPLPEGNRRVSGDINNYVVDGFIGTKQPENPGPLSVIFETKE